MQWLTCPLNGARPVEEFAYGGAVRRPLNPEACSDAQWSDHVFNNSTGPAIQREWWCHVPSGHWFIAERDTVNDVVVRTYGAERLREPAR